MKRILSGLLSLIVIATMAVSLISCGGTKSGDNTLVWYVVGDKPAAYDTVIAKANEIIESAIGMKLDMQYIDAASLKKESIKLNYERQIDKI